MTNFSEELNQEQLKVVTHGDGYSLVLAGAGSGKTRTITYRVAYLLEKGVKPENILLVTFTNKAAREMLERVGRLVAGDNFHLPWSGTFHHIAYKILRRYAGILGYDKNNPAVNRTSEASSGLRFTVLDSDDSLEMLKLCLRDEGIDRKEKRFPSPAVLQSIISYARNAETTIEDVLDLKHPHFLGESETIVRLAENYQKRKLVANVMDFDDLLTNWYQLLIKEQGVRNKLSEQFQYILVDEYQDTNKIQASIIDLIASKHRNLLVVGDDAQSIYSFRAADVRNILAFEKKYPATKIFKLETNYRSTPEILNLANNVIDNNLNQYPKNLKSLNGGPFGFAQGKPELHSFEDQSEEAIFIADRIEELLGEGVEAIKIAVLFRAAYHSQALEMELVKRGIDYDYRGGVRFFERAHIKDVLAYLRIVNNVDDDIAWRRVLRMQIGIGDTTTENIISEIKKLGNLEIIGSNLSARAQLGWNDFLQIYQKLNYIKNKNPADLIAEILDSKYVEYLENEYPDYRERIQDIEQLAKHAEQYADNNADESGTSEEKDGLSRFLAEATLQESFRGVDSGQHPPNPPQGGNYNSDKIILSTIHQAKGLEWEVVFVMGLSAGQFPNDRALREDNGLEEERRLFYVAITRAKKYLYLTYSAALRPGSGQGGWGDSFGGPSMFLEEIDKELVDGEILGSVGSSMFDDDVEDVSYVDEDSYVRNTKATKDTKNCQAMRSFLKGLEEL